MPAGIRTEAATTSAVNASAVTRRGCVRIHVPTRLRVFMANGTYEKLKDIKRLARLSLAQVIITRRVTDCARIACITRDNDPIRD